MQYSNVKQSKIQIKTASDIIPLHKRLGINLALSTN